MINGHIKGPLTNPRIDHYALLNRYNQKERQRVLTGIQTGTIKSLDLDIKKGVYGDDAIAALKKRKKRNKRTHIETPEERLDRIFGADYFN